MPGPYSPRPPRNLFSPSSLPFDPTSLPWLIFPPQGRCNRTTLGNRGKRNFPSKVQLCRRRAKNRHVDSPIAPLRNYGLAERVQPRQLACSGPLHKALQFRGDDGVSARQRRSGLRAAIKRPAGRCSGIVCISFTSLSFSFEEAPKNFCSPADDYSAGQLRYGLPRFGYCGERWPTRGAVISSYPSARRETAN